MKLHTRIARSATVAAGLTVVLSAFASPALAASNSREHGERHRTASIVNGAAATPSSSALAPTAQGASVKGQGGGLAANFDGVSSLDSQVTNFGLTFEPPDQGLCAGNGFVVEMVNSAFRVYDTKGKTLAGPTNVNAPFHEDFAAFTSDPRCHYDAATNTWFASVLFINDASTASTEDIAYNTSGEGAPASSGCPCFGDQPRLGIDASNVYISTDEFSIVGPQFDGATIYA